MSEQIIGMSGMFAIENDVAIVTGATGKLGTIWVDTLLKAGARVSAWDLATATASQGYGELSARSDASRLMRVDCDVTVRESITAALQQVTSRWGVPSIVVNNAGVDGPPDAAAHRARAEDLPVDLMRRMIDVNLIGTLQVMQVVGGAMAAARRGSIINIGSLYASVSPDQRFYDHFKGEPPFLKLPSYGASKAGVVNLTKYFATLWGPQGVRVNTLSPGGVLASQDEGFRKKYCERVPMGRMAVADDLRGPLLFLASPASCYMTGSELRIDGGFTAW